MATSRGQTHNKRARELALREKRERKQAKKDDRRAGIYPATVDDEAALAENLEQPDAEGEIELQVADVEPVLGDDVDG